MDPTLAAHVLDLLKQKGASALRLLYEFHTDTDAHVELWAAHPELYEAFVPALVAQGHPTQAFDLGRERWRQLGVTPGPGDTVAEGPRLRYHLARATVNGGNDSYGELLLRPILAMACRPDADVPAAIDTALRVDIIALMGRIWKDRARADRDALPRAIEWYRRAATVPGADRLPDAGTYPLINVAVLTRLAGDKAEAEQVAEEVLARARRCLAAGIDDIWLLATAGEAEILLGRHDDAMAHLTAAVKRFGAEKQEAMLIALRATLQRLETVEAIAPPKWLEDHLGNVVVFSGHMIDAPDRAARRLTPRFPASALLENAVAEEIERRLHAMNATVGYASLACGSDILFAEAMLKRRAELHVVLPFEVEDFVRLSVTFGQADAGWQRWLTKFRYVLEAVGPERTHFATAEPYLNTDDLFDFVNDMTQGLAVLRARQRLVTPRALVALDAGSKAAVGGTQYFLDSWKRAGHPAEVIDLAELRGKYWRPTPTATAGRVPPPPGPKPRPISRKVKTVLFADVQNYSKISDNDLPDFLQAYTHLLQRLFASPVGQRAVFANTWGDGLYVVFDSVPDGAAFAVALLDPSAVVPGGWASFGFTAGAPVRVALHTGPVYELPDLFQGRAGFSGQHVSRAARIEPVTMPGCAYASEQFASLLAMAPADRRVPCEYVGIHQLAKNYDRCPLYQIRV